MQLQLRTWPEVEAYLAASRGIVVPIGSTEQHGPTGLIGTDAICAEVIARALGEATGAMVAPTIAVGMAAHHMAFAGTITLRPATLMLVVRDCVLSLAEHGFERFLFVNGHGGNIATVRAAFSDIHAELSARAGETAPRLHLRLASWWDNEAVTALSRELYADRLGSHATPSEIAVTQWIHPDHVKRAPLDPPLAPHAAPSGTPPSGSSPAGFHDARAFRRRYPDGRIGSDPSLARPEHGRRLVEASVEALSDTWRDLMAEE